MPRCRVIDPAFTWGEDRAPRTAWERTVIYELHVRGYTKLHPSVPEVLRGTYRGLTEPQVLDHIRSLGVTAVELLPVHTFVNDSYLHDKGLTNYWGYNTISFLRANAALRARARFRLRRVQGNGGALSTRPASRSSSTLSTITPPKAIISARRFRSKASTTPRIIGYCPNEPRYYINDTGTGNTFNLSHPRVLQMVTDSLRYWVQEMHVDGFRFDLGTILARETHGFDQGGGFLDSCGQDPVLSSVKLIAEPWDIGPGGYQVGGFPPGWAEWNDRYRDTVRSYWKGDEGKLPEFAARITGSGDLFNRRGRKPWASVNFVTAHDGFTLNDLVSYNDKHNEANGEENRDGHSDNYSWNHGVEGPTDDPEIVELRERQKRNFLGTLLFSQGTPMILAADEFGRTQRGNNNAYCQDNEISWVDWRRDDRADALIDFTKRLTSFAPPLSGIAAKQIS